MPPIRSSAFKRRSRLVLLILSLGEIMPSYSYCVEKWLSYVAILALSDCQPSSYTKCACVNMWLLCNIRLVFNTKYMFFTYRPNL